MDSDSFTMKASLEDPLLNKISETLKNMETEWNMLELSKEVQEIRSHAAIRCISEVCDKLLADERAMRERINKRIMDHKAKVICLCNELCMSYEEPNNMSLLKLDTFLQGKVAELTEEREERFKELRELLDEDRRLCHFLAESPFSISANLLPSVGDLQQIRDHIQDMNAEKDLRIKSYNSLKKDIIIFSEQLEKSLDNELLLDIVCNAEHEACLSNAYLQDIRKLHSDLEFDAKELYAESLELRDRVSSLWSLLKIGEDKRSAFLTTLIGHTPTCIKKLQEELDQLKEMRRQNLSLYINDLKSELQKWWGKCYVGENSMQSFLQVNSEVSEEVLEAFEVELNKWKKYFSTHSFILEKVDYFLRLFDKMQQLEEKAKDPTRLFNTRGGALLQEEKERKKVKSELPLVQTQLMELGLDYQAKNGVVFLIEGKSIEDYLTYLWSFHDHQREREKNRLHNKNKNLSQLSKKTLKATPSITPGGATARKRARDVDEVISSAGSKKVAKGLFTTNGPTMFRSPLKSLKTVQIQAPSSVPTLRPLNQRNHRIPTPFKQHSNDDTFVQAPSAFTYDIFKTAIDDMHTKDVIHSSHLQDEVTEIPGLLLDYHREKYLRDSLNLASPSKRVPPKTQRHLSPVPGGAAGGAYLKRSLSQSSIGTTPRTLKPRQLWLM